ncbi:hypothetical protein RN001_004389 [Aquatica leii]|uniref:Uncharacterized protein n=1 Tax=Aquatica leii TaxID=1421715 RepID=A0AAN7SRN9_9COLE|nr:hypothetical protein RN001_004389 [Aquatica leii]
MRRKIKRKFVRTEAKKACAKEAAASRLALEALQREIASTPQVSSFVIEESCTETTVKNFIPHTEDTYIENLDQIDNVPQLQVVNFDDLNNSFVNSQIINLGKTENVNNMIQFGVPPNSTKDKLKHILGTDIPGNVEIMFRTSEGHFVNVTDDVLQNLSGGSLQYQIVDENGQVGEIRALDVQDQSLPNFEETSNMPVANISQESTNGFIPTECNNEDSLQNLPDVIAQESKSDPDYIVSSDTSSAGSKTSSSISTSSESKLDEADSFIDALRNCDTNNSTDLYQETIFDGCSDLLTMKDITDANKEENLGCAKFDKLNSTRDVIYVNDTDIDHIIDITSDVNDDSGGGDDNDYAGIKRRLLSQSPKKNMTDFNSKISKETTLDSMEEHSLASGDAQLFNLKIDKPRRIMPARKKK